MGLLIKLQNGDTALKSLKFGNDRPGGGDSGQPYIQDPILDNLTPESKDFLLRGGSNASKDAAQDVVRLTKYMFDSKSSSGLLFIAKQNLLSRTAPKTEASKGIGYAGGILNGGVYTPLSTLAQAGIGFRGNHLNKQGIDPTGLIPGLSIRDYEKVAYNNNLEEANIILGPGNAVFKNRLLDLWWDKQEYTNNSFSVLSYGGGPNSILGIGKTFIKFAKDGNGAPLRTGVNNSLAKSNKKFFEEGGPVRPKSSGPDQDRVDYYNTLGASITTGSLREFPLTGAQLGLGLSGDLQRRFFGPEDGNKILGKYKPNDTPLSGSEGYQIGNNIKYQTQKSDTTYYSPIGKKLQDYGRELLSDSTFTIGDTWVATSQKNNQQILLYNSQPSLALDKSAVGVGDNTEVSKALKKSEPDSNKKGYLANLNKNSGPYIDPITNIYTFTNNPLREGGRGIAGDFRLTTRKKRGFFDAPDAYDKITDSTDYSSVTTIDRIYYDSLSDKRTSKPLNESGENVDLIPFRFEIINPINPTNSPEILTFRAYIDNFSDTYSPEWKSQTYMGRAEKFYKYDSFDRSISLGFTIVADNKTNMDTMYIQLNTLAASLAPTYTPQGYMAGNLHKLTIGNYIYNQVGIINGFTYEIMDESPWDIDKYLPFYIKVTGIKFTPIHNFRPESQFNITHQYINQTLTKPKPTDRPIQDPVIGNQ